MEKMSVAVISGPVGKTPEDITYSFVFDETYRLAEKGINIHIVRSKVEANSFSCGMHFHGIGKKLDIQTIGLMLRNFPLYPPIALLRRPTSVYWEQLYASNVSNVIENYCVDLIHAHFAYPEGLVGLLAKRRTRKPLVVTIHGYDICIEPSIRYGVRLSKRIDAIVSQVLNNADAVVAASKATFNEANKIVNNIDKVHLIRNGVDIQRFNPNLDGSKIGKKLGIEGRTVIFSLRAHEPKYGLEYLIRAAPMVAKEREDAVFVIGGDGSLRYYHEQLADRLGIRERIIFTGRIPQHELPYYYATSNIIAIPSLQEAFGLVVSEAMACGKPVVGTEVGGIPDQLTDGYNGFLVAPRNPEEIAKKILFLIDHPEDSKRMGINGRKLVKEKFNIDTRIKRIIQLYRELLQK
jgi:glycosyltransferase involved in cell wall biosynthesis